MAKTTRPKGHKRGCGCVVCARGKRKAAPKAKAANRPAAQASGSEVQSVAFPTAIWTEAQAKAWLKEHGYKVGALDRTANYLRFRQADPAAFSSFGTLKKQATVAGKRKPFLLVVGGQREGNPQKDPVTFDPAAGEFRFRSEAHYRAAEDPDDFDVAILEAGATPSDWTWSEEPFYEGRTVVVTARRINARTSTPGHGLYGHRCRDPRAGVTYPEHEWGEEGRCRRCEQWLPGTTREHKAEVEAQDARRRGRAGNPAGAPRLEPVDVYDTRGNVERVQAEVAPKGIASYPYPMALIGGQWLPLHGHGSPARVPYVRAQAGGGYVR